MIPVICVYELEEDHVPLFDLLVELDIFNPDKAHNHIVKGDIHINSAPVKNTHFPLRRGRHTVAHKNKKVLKVTII